MPCHHNRDEYLHAYIDQVLIDGYKKGFLFRSSKGRSGLLSENAMGQADVCRMIGRKAAAASIASHQDRMPLLWGEGDHRIPSQWWQARSGPADGQP